MIEQLISRVFYARNLAHYEHWRIFKSTLFHVLNYILFQDRIQRNLHNEDLPVLLSCRCYTRQYD